MPELAEVAYACSLWNKGLKKSIKQVEIKEQLGSSGMQMLENLLSFSKALPY